MYENGDKPTVLQNEKAPFDDEAFLERIATVDPSNSTLADAPYFYNGRYAMSEEFIPFNQRAGAKLGFFKLMRAAEELFEEDFDAFSLLTQIAFRALRKDSKYNKHRLLINQALVGDYKKLNLTEQKYRDAKYRIEHIYKLVTFKGTNKGTIATLLSTEIYDINADSNNEQNNDQGTNRERTENEQRTTKEEVKNVRSKECKNINPLNPPTGDSSLCSQENDSSFFKKEKKKCKKVEVSELALTLTDYFHKKIKSAIPKILDFTPQKRQSEAQKMDNMLRLDGRSEEEIRTAIDYLVTDIYIYPYTQTIGKFREKYTTIWPKMPRNTVKKLYPPPSGNYIPTSDHASTVAKKGNMQGGKL